MMIGILLSALVVVLAFCLTVGIAYWRIARRFVPGDAHALDGIVQAPMARDVVGPRVLTAGLHVNGPKGYVSGGLAAHLDPAGKAESAVEIERAEDIEPRLNEHIARGVDVIKIATTHGDIGFHDAKPDLPEAWVREIVRVAHGHGLAVTPIRTATMGTGPRSAAASMASSTS